jgi:hypothetical protein
MKKQLILLTFLISAFTILTTQTQTQQPQQETRMAKLTAGLKTLLGYKPSEQKQTEHKQRQTELAAQALSKHCGVKCQPGEKCCMPTYNGGYTTCKAQCPKGFVEI